ncbi:unnamed protein product [Camellia sinensis]
MKLSAVCANKESRIGTTMITIPFTLTTPPFSPLPDPDSCDFCGKSCREAFKYKCIDCPFMLDVKCALLAPTANKKIQFQRPKRQPNHSHPLILCDMVKSFDYTCCCCGSTIDGDCVYSLHRLNYLCSQCKFVVDVNCARLKPEQGQIQQFRHPHPLIFCNNKENFPYTCSACRLPLADSIYFCPECPALLHKSCADLPREIEHLFHPHYTLTLKNDWDYKDGIPYCQACLHCCLGFFYKCCQCKWYIDVRCACLPESTILRWSKIHHHPLALIFSTENIRQGCNICKKCFSTPFFRCLLCDFNLHVHCISGLPPTLKYHNHVHFLTFTNCPIKDRPDEDDNAEFYCDACEKRSDLAQPTYYCEVGCQFVAHPHCVVSEREKRQQKDNLLLKLHEYESLVLTLKDFLDSFTENENKEVQGLFEAYRRDVRGESGILPKILNPNTILGFEEGYNDAHLDKVSAWIVKKYVSRVEVAMPWEKWDTTSKYVKPYTACFQVGHDVLVDFNLAEYIAQITKQQAGIDSKDIAIIEEDEESVDSEELTIIEEDEEIVDSEELAIIEEDEEMVDSEELAIIEDEETHYLREKVDSMQLTIIKLDEAIKDLEKKKQALLKKRKDWCIRKECLIDALELKGQMAGTATKGIIDVFRDNAS